MEYHLRRDDAGSLDEVVGEVLNKIEIVPKEYTFIKKIFKDVAPAITGGLIVSVFLYYMI